MSGRDLNSGVLYPGHGLPPRPSVETPQTLYALLCEGRSLGKRVSLLVNSADNGSLISPAKVNILQVDGANAAAMNLTLTISPPRVIPVGGATGISLARAQELVESQQASGTMDFADVEDGNLGVACTPTIVLIDHGVGGVSTHHVEVDVLNGLTCTLSGSFVRVGVAPDPLLAKFNIAAGSDAIYELAAHLAPGSSKPSTAQRTIQLGLVQGPEDDFFFGTSGFAPIPKFATQVALNIGGGPFVDPNSMLGWIVQVIFFESCPSTGYQPQTNPAFWPAFISTAMIADNGNGNRWITIPNGAQYVASRSRDSAL